MDCSAHLNPDMRKLINDWGWDWYGRYFTILGEIGMLVTEKHRTFSLQTNNGKPFPVKLLANDLSTTVKRLTTFLNYLADNDLIDKESWTEKSLIYCPKLQERSDEYTKKLLTKSRHTTEQEVHVEVEEERTAGGAYGSESYFNTVWKLYPNREGKKAALRHYKATVKTETDFKNINIALQNYLRSSRVKQGFIKNGSTFFNQWQDWISPTETMIGKKKTDVAKQTPSYQDVSTMPDYVQHLEEQKRAANGKNITATT